MEFQMSPKHLSLALVKASILIALCFAYSILSTAVPLKVRQGAQTQRPVRPFPPTQYVPDHNFDTRHIALVLSFDWEREQLLGNETITLAPLLNNLHTIELDAANITVTSAKLSSGKVLKFENDPDKQRLRIELDRNYQPSDELILAVDYHTNGPQKGSVGFAGTGLRFIKPSAEDPKRPKQIWSQGESEYNHYWFPCYDHPNDFFTSEITATVEKPLSVISNGELVATKENKDGTRTFHWQMAQPHASYLSSIVVGEYTPIVSDYAGIPIVTNVYPNELAEGKVTTARLVEMVKFFSEKTGLKYPYAKYAQTTVRDFGGGMENISATTQTDNMIHDARTELDQTSDGLQSHELAHQWFGDYLTCRTWADIWLNESFATYFQAMWDEHKLGGDDFLYTDVKGNQDAYFNAWKQGNRRPIVTKNYASPDAVFDTYAYPRGGAVLHMLRKDLGEENWWRAINHYLNKYAHQPVETEQFRIAIEEATGQSMDWFFDEWLYRMGHPVFLVTQDYDATNKTLKLKVEQQQKKDPDSEYPQAGFFQTPVEIEVSSASGTEIKRVQIEPRKEQTFTFKVDTKPLLVNFDYNRTLIKELEFKKSTEDLIYQVANDRDVLGRVWALSQLTDRLNGQSSSEAEKQTIATHLTTTLANDKFWGLRVEAANSLAAVKSDSARAALVAATKDRDARVRAKAVQSLTNFKDSSLVSLYQQLLNDESYGVIKAAAAALGQTKSPAAYDVLVKLFDTPSWHDNIKTSALGGLATLEDNRAVGLAFKYSEKGNYSPVRAAALRLLGKVGRDDSRAFTMISETIGQAVEKRDFALAVASAEALVSLGDSRGLAVLEKISASGTNSPQLKNLINQFHELLQKGIASRNNKVPDRP